MSARGKVWNITVSCFPALIAPAVCGKTAMAQHLCYCQNRPSSKPVHPGSLLAQEVLPVLLLHVLSMSVQPAHTLS